MACYVDSVRPYPEAGLRFTHFCHLLADSRAELHTIAIALGMPERAYTEHPWRWHYDLPEHLRAEALTFGAIEIEMHAVGAILKARKLALLG